MIYKFILIIILLLIITLLYNNINFENFNNYNYIIFLNISKNLLRTCPHNINNKIIGYTNQYDYLFIKAIEQGYRIKAKKLIKLNKELPDLNIVDFAIIGINNNNNIFQKSLYNFKIFINVFDNIDIKRIKLFIPINIKNINIKKYFQDKNKYILNNNNNYINIPILENKYLNTNTNINTNKNNIVNNKLYDYNDINVYESFDNKCILDNNYNNNFLKYFFNKSKYNYNNINNYKDTSLYHKSPYYEFFISRLNKDPEIENTKYHCYGDFNIKNKYLCNLKTDPLGNIKKKFNIWDKPCEFNEECPFYNKITNEGKCNQKYCEFPIGVKRLSYTKYNDKLYNKPFCKNKNFECLKNDTNYIF